eukprot:1873002-Amphidinium_carterae.1
MGTTGGQVGARLFPPHAWFPVPLVQEALLTVPEPGPEGYGGLGFHSLAIEVCMHPVAQTLACEELRHSASEDGQWSWGFTQAAAVNRAFTKYSTNPMA